MAGKTHAERSFGAVSAGSLALLDGRQPLGRLPAETSSGYSA